MDRSERRTYFERLCSLRDGYAASAVDRRGVLSIEDAILYGEAVMTALDEPAWDESGIGATGGVETEARVTADAQAGVTPESDPAEPADPSIGIVEFDGSTSRTRRVRRPDWPFGPRPAGRWASDADGWRPIR